MSNERQTPRRILPAKTAFAHATIPRHALGILLGTLAGLVLGAQAQETLTAAARPGSDASAESAPAQGGESSAAEQRQLVLLGLALAIKLALPEQFGAAGGVLITEVLPDSQGQSAGLQPGDILIGYDDRPLDSAEQLVELTGASAEHRPVALCLLRLGEPLEVSIHGGRLGTAIRAVDDPNDFHVEAKSYLLVAAGRLLASRGQNDLAHRMLDREKTLGVKTPSDHEGTASSALDAKPSPANALPAAPSAADAEITPPDTSGAIERSSDNYPTPSNRAELRGLVGNEGMDKEILETLNSGMARLIEDGRYEEALPIAALVLGYAESILGTDHPDTLVSVDQLADLYRFLGRHDEAEGLYRRVLASRERMLGTDHLDTLRSLTDLAHVYSSQDRYNAAERMYQRALTTRERVLGAEHYDTLENVTNLAVLYLSQRRYAEAEPLFQRVIEASERVLGAEHEFTLVNYVNMAFLYERQGRPGDAESFYRRALNGGERGFGTQHPVRTFHRSNLAEFYRRRGRWAEAEKLYRRTVVDNARELGSENLDTLGAESHLADLLYFQGRYGEAEPLLRRALAAYERLRDAEHADTLELVNRLALVYDGQGRHGEAEPLLRRALHARERVLGTEHRATLRSVSNLAALYYSQGRYGEAEPLLLRTLDSLKRVLGPEHLETLNASENLAVLYETQGRHADAEALLLPALQTRERVLGAEHPSTLDSLHSLATLRKAQGRNGEAEALYGHVLQTSERVLGAEHPDTLRSVSNLALLYKQEGRYDEAEPLYRRALEARERLLGSSHPDALDVLGKLAVLYGATVRRRDFGELLLLWDPAARAALRLSFSTTRSARVQRQQLARSDEIVDVACTNAIEAPDDKALSEFCANLRLRWKRIGSAEAEVVARVSRTSDDPKVRELAAEVAEARANLAGMILIPEPDQAAITKERERLEELESQLATRSQAFREQDERAETDWRRVSAALPPGSLLLDLRRHLPFDFKSDEWGDPHWLAVSIHPGGDAAPAPEVIDLGPAAPTRAWIRELISADSADARRSAASALYGALIAPLSERLAGVRRVYLSPDGLLDLVPFAALRDGDGKYWIEAQDIRILRTGRDLLPLSATAGGAAGGLLALGGIDYARFADSEPAPPPGADAQAMQATRSLLGERAARLSWPAPEEPPPSTAPPDAASPNPPAVASAQPALVFPELKATDSEARGLASLFETETGASAQLLTGTRASEAELKVRAGRQAQPPRILHLATHGFFRPAPGSTAERPLTLTGIALAGANRGMAGDRSPTGDNGVLSALEAQDLNLAGTALVALSACDTGKGEIDAAEGVYGLVRSFQLAGARNVLMTLWPLDDALAADFMLDFYRTWLEDNAYDEPAEALRATQLAWIRSGDARKSDPYFWAPYVVVERR
jgi:CHAT domain-containing protein/tetratricopeptide (TPR) repeat protein